MKSITARGISIFVVFSAVVSVTVGRTVFFTKPCLDSPSEQPFKILKDIQWDIECARQCKHESECMFMAFKSSPEKECLLFNSHVNISESGTGGELQLYQMHEELVCEHGVKTPDDKCNCTDSYVGRRCDRIMEDCSEGYESGFYKGQHATFWIKPKLSASLFEVHCYMVYGKTFLQKNSIWNFPFESFDRTWQEYVDGFGNVSGHHWLGLQRAYEITNSRDYDLMITIHAKPNYNNKTIIYHNFKISDAASEFYFTVDSAEPTTSWPLDDCLSALNNTRFSSPDMSTPSCAAATHSGWWFDDSCSGCNLNGNIEEDRSETGAFWNAGFLGDTIVYTEMVLLAV